MLHGDQRGCLFLEHFHLEGFISQVAEQDFQRNRAIQFQMMTQVNRSHTPFTQQAIDPDTRDYFSEQPVSGSLLG